MKPTHDYADKRLERAMQQAVFATLTALALMLGALLLLRLMNPDLFAEGAVSFTVRQGQAYNWDLLGLVALAMLYLIPAVLPALLFRETTAMRIAQWGVGILASGSMLAALVIFLCDVFGVLRVDYVMHFYPLVGGFLLAGAWLLTLQSKPGRAILR